MHFGKLLVWAAISILLGLAVLATLGWSSDEALPAEGGGKGKGKPNIAKSQVLAEASGGGKSETLPAPEPPPSLAPDGGPDSSSAVDPREVVDVEPPENQIEELRRIEKQAGEQYGKMDSYIVRFRRREQIDGRDRKEEIISLKFRKQPWSVSLKWLGQEGKGREAVYVKDHYDNKIHTRLAAGDVWPMPAGTRISLSPDSPLVKSASRRNITDAGVGTLIEHFGSLVERAARADDRQVGDIHYLGKRNQPEFKVLLDAVEETIAPRTEAQLPQGGHRLWYFDRTNHLPALIITRDENDHVVEYFCYDRYQTSVKLDEDDFNPQKLWGKLK